MRDVMESLAVMFPETAEKVEKKNDNEYYVDLKAEDIREAAGLLRMEYGYPLILLFANDERKLQGGFMLYYTFADRENSNLYILKTRIDAAKPEFLSVCDTIPSAAGYEREIQDLFGLIPVGHPDPKRLVLHGNWPDGEYPLRKEFDRVYKPVFANKEISFQKVHGEGVYEIPVGPVHAGIIEPGHFRFSVAGEPIINLEAQLYFVHKGIEKLCEGESIERGLFFSERISGDETFANSDAYCQAVEKIAGIEIPERAAYLRMLFAELERLTNHLGDLGGLCLDTAYGFATFQYRMMKGWAYGTADELCGSRFLRSVNKPGGVRKDFLQGKERSILGQLTKIKSELEDTVAIVKANSMFIDRVENAGLLKREIADDLNAVGPGGRASGVPGDVRRDFPYGAYRHVAVNAAGDLNGDICARMNVKIEECFEAIRIMQEAIDQAPDGRIVADIGHLEPYRSAFGINEAARGENIHWLMTGENDSIFRYKIRTPSFCNWPALCHAVRGNIVPDFPLVNKSFNLSYAGNDL